jgi:hypothetical protein
MRGVVVEDWREEILLRLGLILMMGTGVLAAFINGSGGAGTVLAAITLLLAVGPVDRLRRQLSLAGHQVPGVAVFILGVLIAGMGGYLLIA